MEKENLKLYERLNNKNNCEDYVPVIEIDKGFYMIWNSKIAKASRETRRRYHSYLESKDSDIEQERLNVLVKSIDTDSEKRKGIWFDLDGFIERLDEENIELVKRSIKRYK